MLLFLKGTIIGFIIAVPVGPVGVLSIQRTLSRGMLSGFVLGLGSALAAFGMTVAAGFLQDNQFYLEIIGGIILIYLGCHIFYAKPAISAPEASGSGMFNDFVSSFFLTLTNPLMILFFAIGLAGSGLDAAGKEYLPALLFVLGVLTGSVMLWLMVSGMVSRARANCCFMRLRIFNQVSGTILAGLGMFCLSKMLFYSVLN